MRELQPRPLRRVIRSSLSSSSLPPNKSLYSDLRKSFGGIGGTGDQEDDRLNMYVKLHFVADLGVMPDRGLPSNLIAVASDLELSAYLFI